MKKIFIFLSAIALCTTISTKKAAAQDYDFLSFGIKAGVNVTTVTGLSDIIGAAHSDFSGGIFAEVRPLSFLGVTAELLYSGNGFNVENNSSLLNPNYRVDFGTIDVPIMAKLYLTPNFSVNAGIMPSFIIDSKINIADTELNFNTVGFSIPVGISYEFDFGVILDARYKFGLTDINSVEQLGTNIHNITNHMKGEGFTFSVGIRL